MGYTNTINRLRDAHAVFAMLDTLCSEMGTLIDANPGTTGHATNGIGNPSHEKDLALRIEAVTVCVDYADFLEVTLPSIRAAVDDLVVVTAPTTSGPGSSAGGDGVRAVVTTAMHDHGRRFTLGAAIDAGLAVPAARPTGLWSSTPISCCRRGTHRTLQHLQLDPGEALRDRPRSLPGLGGAGTGSRPSPRAVRELARSPFAAGLPDRGSDQSPGRGSRGYVPCGYFQLWNAGATGYRDYPIHRRGTAEGSDMLHSLSRFPRQYRRADSGAGRDPARDRRARRSGRRQLGRAADGGVLERRGTVPTGETTETSLPPRPSRPRITNRCRSRRQSTVAAVRPGPPYRPRPGRSVRRARLRPLPAALEHPRRAGRPVEGLLGDRHRPQHPGHRRDGRGIRVGAVHRLRHDVRPGRRGAAAFSRRSR